MTRQKLIKIKKRLIKIIKIRLLEGHKTNLFYEKALNEWILEDGNSENVMVRACKLLSERNSTDMMMFCLLLHYLEKNNSLKE